jgi:hypothetical protein
VTKGNEPLPLSVDLGAKPDLTDLFDKFDIGESIPDTKSDSVASNEKASFDDHTSTDDHVLRDGKPLEMVEVRVKSFTTQNKIPEQLNVDDSLVKEQESETLTSRTSNLKLAQECASETIEVKDTAELTDQDDKKEESDKEQQNTDLTKQPFSPSDIVSENKVLEDKPSTASTKDNANDDSVIDLTQTLEGNKDLPEVEDTDTMESRDQSKLSSNFQLPTNSDYNNKAESSSVNSTRPREHELAHKPFDFQVFLTQLRKKSADPIARYIRSFLISLTRQGYTFTAEQRIKIIVEFKEFMNEKFTMFEPFASMDETDLENSREGLEKLIMNRLYDQCFPPEVAKQGMGYIPDAYSKDIESDRKFAEQYEKYSWVTITHLDIDLDKLSKQKKGDTTFIDYAIKELNKINNYRAPRDKIICILNACKIIFGFLKVSNQETNADSFIPLLIIVIIKAKTDHLISNLHYIESYRGEEWLTRGETSYYLSSLQAAATFIVNLSKEDLSIEEEEYEAHMEAWQAEKKQRNLLEQSEDALEQPQPHPASSVITQHLRQDNLSPSNVLLTSAEMFTKSISNFLSPSPQDEPKAIDQEVNVQPEQTEQNLELIKKTYDNLHDIFPDLDDVILKDMVIMNNGNFDQSLEQCLQLMNEV